MVDGAQAERVQLRRGVVQCVNFGFGQLPVIAFVPPESAVEPRLWLHPAGMVVEPDLLQPLLPIRPGLAGPPDHEPPPEWAEAEKPSPPERLLEPPDRADRDPLLPRDSRPSPWLEIAARRKPARASPSDEPA